MNSYRGPDFPSNFEKTYAKISMFQLWYYKTASNQFMYWMMELTLHKKNIDLGLLLCEVAGFAMHALCIDRNKNAWTLGMTPTV